MNDFGNVPESFITDPLAIDSGHALVGMAHDVIHRHLIAGLTGDCLERVA